MVNGKKILLVHLFSNGDCLYATAVARQIKHDYPGCHLTWAIAGFCKNLLTGNPYVDTIMEVNTVTKSDIVAYRAFKKELHAKKMNGEFDEIFNTTILDNNIANYDGCIRTTVFNAYPHPITEGIQPVFRSTDEEVLKVKNWAAEKKLASFDTVILFEFAPQSGQLNINTDMALSIARKVTENSNIAIILSSANKIASTNPAIIDGSELSYRETIYLSNYCSMLLGCSSGITWGTTSDGGKMLPMVQILNPWTPWVNAISRDFERQGMSTANLIELVEFTEDTIADCINCIKTDGFAEARARYSQSLPLHFKTTRRIVYNLMCYLQFDAIAKHIVVNKRVYGLRWDFIKQVFKAILGFPIILIRNKINKNLLP